MKTIVLPNQQTCRCLLIENKSFFKVQKPIQPIANEPQLPISTYRIGKKIGTYKSTDTVPYTLKQYIVIDVINIINQAHERIGILKLYPNREG
jgi:hypothetical protein